MFATCLHCHNALGANEELEAFPVGKRLAFDSAKGRLWVICPSCERWNLSPLEERWEAVERAETLYRATPTRVATDEIGMARIRSGLELIRIGKPMRPEFAAWRYGRQLQSRFRRAWFERGMQAMEDDGFIDDMGMAAIFLGWTSAVIAAPFLIARAVRQEIADARIIRGVVVDGKAVRMKGYHLKWARFTADPEQRWRLHLSHEGGHTTAAGGAVLPLLGQLLPHVNDVGASTRQLNMAVAKIEHFKSPERFLDFLAAKSPQTKEPLATTISYAQRLALEMMAHEDSERRAMEGELAALHAQWVSAEEIAAIADNLLVPAWIRHRVRGGG